MLRGTWAGYTVAVKKVVGERFRSSDLEALREELNPLKYVPVDRGRTTREGRVGALAGVGMTREGRG